MMTTIQVLERREGLVPSVIKSQGEILKIDAVNRCWTETASDQESIFYHFQVRCGRKWYQLSENIKTGTWSMQIGA